MQIEVEDAMTEAAQREKAILTGLIFVLIAATVGVAFTEQYGKLAPFFAFTAALVAGVMRRNGLHPNA